MYPIGGSGGADLRALANLASERQFSGFRRAPPGQPCIRPNKCPSSSDRKHAPDNPTRSSDTGHCSPLWYEFIQPVE